MIYELAIQTLADPSRRREFIRVFKRAIRDRYGEALPRGKILSCVEHPERVIFILEWDSVETHQRHSADDRVGSERVVAALAPFRIGREMAHYEVEDLREEPEGRSDL